MAKIFISYSSDSRDLVEALVQDLNHDGHETWFDQRLTGAGGQPWWDKILSEIRACDIFVAALTPDSLESVACQRELNYAGRLQKPLCPVRLSDKVQPEALPHRLAELQWVDYCHRDISAFKNLQQTTRGLPDAPPLPEPLPDPPPVPLSYLGTLREQIDTESPLAPKDQSYLVFELRSQFQDGGPANEIIDLLQRLKKRRELLANVQRGIDELLGDINRGKRDSLSGIVREPPRATPSPQVPPSGLSILRDRIGKKSPLAINDQFQLLFELRRCFDDGSPAEEIADLLQRLKSRRELLLEVAREIDKLQADIDRKEPRARSDSKHTVSNGTAKELRKDQVRKPGPEDGLRREIKLDSGVADYIERVLGKGECWVFEIDPRNCFSVKLDTSAAAPRMMATASLIDTIGGAKAAELKALEWTVDPAYLIKAGVAGAAMYITGGLAAAGLLSRGVRDFFRELEASRSWIITDPKDVSRHAAADLILAIRKVAPEAKTIIVRRQEDETEE